LRAPFRIAANVGSKAARGVNRTVDSSHKAASLVSHAISNKWDASTSPNLSLRFVTCLLRRLPPRRQEQTEARHAKHANQEEDTDHCGTLFSRSTLVKRLSDSLASAQETAERVVSPHLEPLQPYFNRIRPYIPPAMLVGLLMCLPPVIFLLSLAAFITSPIWIVALVIASPIWIPMAIFTGAATFLGLVIGAIRVLSTAQAQRVLAPVWVSVSSTSLGQAIFFSSRKL